jgi:hypothetical protein
MQMTNSASRNGTDLTKHESRWLDQLVYALNGLTQEEIKIVESAFAPASTVAKAMADRSTRQGDAAK